MLLPSRVAGRTLGLRGPDLARGPEVARLWFKILNGFENVDCNIQARGYERTPLWKVNYTNDLAPFVN